MPRNKSMDFEKPFGTVRSTIANDSVKYLQGDSYYDHSGEFVRLVSGAKAAVKPRPVPQAVKKTPADLRREAISAAADKLLGSAPPAPQSLQDAAKENAEALAAEENAE